MYKVDVKNNSVKINQTHMHSFIWVHCQAYDCRTGKMVDCELWFDEKERDDFKREASRILNKLGYSLNRVDEFYSTSAPIDALANYNIGLDQEKKS